MFNYVYIVCLRYSNIHLNIVNIQFNVIKDPAFDPIDTTKVVIVLVIIDNYTPLIWH